MLVVSPMFSITVAMWTTQMVRMPPMGKLMPQWRGMGTETQLAVAMELKSTMPSTTHRM